MVLWLLLWRSVSPLTVVTGVVTALVVVRVFELPPVPHVGSSGRSPRSRSCSGSSARWSSPRSRSQARRSRRSRPTIGPRPGVVAAQLRTRDDLVLTLTGIVTSLIPGTVIVEVDRAESVLYLHVLRGGTPERLAAARAAVLDAERRVVLAIGSPGEQAVVR